MKKIFLLLFIPICSWAQFSAGNKFFGGSIGIHNENNNLNSFNNSLNQSINVSPSVGFFLNENLAVGVRVGYSNNYSEYRYSTQKSSSQESFSGGFFARRFFTISEKFLFAIDGSVSYVRTTLSGKFVNNIYNDIEIKSYNITAAVNPTFIYLPSDHWGIEATLGSLYFTHSYSFTNEINANTFNLNYGSFSLGFAYYIR